MCLNNSPSSKSLLKKKKKMGLYPSPLSLSHGYPRLNRIVVFLQVVWEKGRGEKHLHPLPSTSSSTRVPVTSHSIAQSVSVLGSQVFFDCFTELRSNNGFGLKESPTLFLLDSPPGRVSLK